jgi:hypothetical protein
MILNGLHILLTYQCTLECDHCFVWGSPRQKGTFTLQSLRHVLRQARDLGTIDSIYFEGGEPFLYYSLLLKSVLEASRMGFQVGIVTNGYWANSLEDALAALQPFSGLLVDLSISSDEYHWGVRTSPQVEFILAAANKLGIPAGVISIAQPESRELGGNTGQLPAGESAVMYRGRAAIKLAPQASLHPWEQFDACTCEDLLDPQRLHLDPFGYLHICQGIAIGNLFEKPLDEILAAYDGHSHPICGPILAGGPAELVRRYDLPLRGVYADSCHLCYLARQALMERFPDILAPAQMYGVVS